jgi:hypothetical protein
MDSRGGDDLMNGNIVDGERRIEAWLYNGKKGIKTQ